MDLTIAYPRGAIASERYTLTDENGASRADYAIADRRGTIATFHETIRGYDVAFTFDKMVADGIWKLDSKRPRSADSARYTISIHQTAQQQSGSRTFSFTDPHYWAVAAGHQYHIQLDPHQPTPTQADLLRLQSTSNADPRYAQLVDDFRTFGSPTFHRTVAEARAKLLRS